MRTCATVVEPDSGQDRVDLRIYPDALVIALADGAGGTARGAKIAELVVDRLLCPDRDWDEIDDAARRLGGQATGIWLRIDADGIRGESVGDSAAWLFRGDDAIELTEHQQRKPLIGAGCLPIAFEHAAIDGATLVVASDGLWRYAKLADISVVAQRDPARALVELVRLPDRSLQDDVSVAIAR
jgi:PPM family protein phosphatase